MICLKISFLFFINIVLIPVYLAFFVLSFIVSFIPIFPSVTAKNNFKEHLGITGLKAHLYTSLIFLNYLFYTFEALILHPLYLTHCSLQDDFDLVEAMREMKRIYPQTQNLGFVYVLSHMANIEMHTIPVIRAHKILQQEILPQNKIYALAKPSKFDFLNKFLVWYRERPGMGIFWTDKNLISNMQTAIKKGVSIAMLVDQKPKIGGLFVKFFNQFAAFPISGLRFCMSENLIVIYAAGHRIIPGWMRMKLQCGKNVHLEMQQTSHMVGVSSGLLKQAGIWNSEKIPAKDKMAAHEMSYFVDWLEKEINKKPTQWCWDYRKWSRKPI